MDIKKFYLKTFREFGKHNSSYFNIPAGFMVLIAYLLPGVLSMININFSAFASLILLVVAVFEKRSDMVKFYCLQFCFVSLAFNIFLTILTIIAMFIPIFTLIIGMCSIIIATIMLITYFYSLYNAFKYRAWIMPWVGPFIMDKVLKI